MNGTDDEKLFDELKCFGDYMSGRKTDAKALLPTRKEAGTVYRLIASAPVPEDRIKYLNINTIGYAKTAVSLLTLTELGLIARDSSGYYRAVRVDRKTELTNSSVYRNLLERSETV